MNKEQIKDILNEFASNILEQASLDGVNENQEIAIFHGEGIEDLIEKFAVEILTEIEAI